MFGHVPQAGELPVDAQQPVAPRRPIIQTKETIREMVHGFLAELRACESGCPWTLRDLYSHRGIWYIYMEWFDDEEANRYRTEFYDGLTRLGLPHENPPFEEAWEAGWFPGKATIDEIDAERARERERAG